ncbi:MAG: hypothetical protein PF588_09775 [Candidatus Kapabacteria bacterium]|jgi:hypothetical protein|nr:hypothetical protein [Candidatus Kapabacteria bacterium]
MSKYIKLFLLAPIVLFALVLVSCDSQKETVETQDQQTDAPQAPVKEKTAYEIEADVKLKVFEKLRDEKLDEYREDVKTDEAIQKSATSKATLTCDQIVEFFPKTLKGTKKRPFVRGNMESDKGTLISSVASDFVFENGILSLAIVDYGAKENIPGVELQSFFGLNDRVGFLTGTEDISYGKIYYSYDTLHGNGIYGCLVNDRAIITCRANTMKENIKHVKECEQLFNIKKIAKSIGK